MLKHHKAWLAAHPDRTRNWLECAIAAGFEVHHIDSDYFNNDPRNLVLIERSDHRRLHGAPLYAPKRYVFSEQVAAMAYQERARTGAGWDLIGHKLQISGPRAKKAALLYAEFKRLPWPLAYVPQATRYRRPVYNGGVIVADAKSAEALSSQPLFGPSPAARKPHVLLPHEVKKSKLTALEMLGVWDTSLFADFMK